MVTPTVCTDLRAGRRTNVRGLHDMIQAAMGWTNCTDTLTGCRTRAMECASMEYPEGEIDEANVTVSRRCAGQERIYL